MTKSSRTYRENARRARSIWGQLPSVALEALRQLTDRLALSVAAGDLQLLDDRWYVTHSGLLRIAQRRRCSGIKTTIQDHLSDPVASRWVFRAIVYKGSASRGFVGYGDADPSNISPLIRGAEMRVAETRAVNRALRKAYGIGICSVEELGSLSGSLPFSTDRARSSECNGSASKSQPRLRDQLCVLIREHSLDASLVKAYAAEFCGTETLGRASRDLVESFISHLATSAKENRDALICKLNSYRQPQEVQS